MQYRDDLEQSLEAHRICYHRKRSWCKRYSAFARLHPLPPFLFEGKRWDTYEVEVTDPCSGSSSYGICLWYGRSIPRLLCEGECISGARKTWFQPERVSTPVIGDQPGGVCGPLSRDDTPMLQSVEANRSDKQEVSSTPSRGYFTSNLAERSVREIDETDRSKNPIRPGQARQFW